MIFLTVIVLENVNVNGVYFPPSCYGVKFDIFSLQANTFMCHRIYCRQKKSNLTAQVKCVCSFVLRNIPSTSFLPRPGMTGG